MLPALKTESGEIFSVRKMISVCCNANLPMSASFTVSDGGTSRNKHLEKWRRIAM